MSEFAPEKGVKSPANLLEAIMHTHHKETHGMRDDINEATPLEDVRAPNLFERAKEEVEALIQTIHTKKKSSGHETREEVVKQDYQPEKPHSGSDHAVKTPKFIEKAKETIEKMIHQEKKSSNHHHRETHGRSDDIDEDTPIDEVKGPNVFERAKEEIEAVLEAIHPKKDP